MNTFQIKTEAVCRYIVVTRESGKVFCSVLMNSIIEKRCSNRFRGDSLARKSNIRISKSIFKNVMNMWKTI